MHFSTILYSWQAAFVWEIVRSQLSFAWSQWNLVKEWHFDYVIAGWFLLLTCSPWEYLLPFPEQPKPSSRYQLQRHAGRFSLGKRCPGCLVRTKESLRTGGSKKYMGLQCRNTCCIRNLNEYLTLPLALWSSLSASYIPLSPEALFGWPLQEMLWNRFILWDLFICTWTLLQQWTYPYWIVWIPAKKRWGGKVQSTQEKLQGSLTTAPESPHLGFMLKSRGKLFTSEEREVGLWGSEVEGLKKTQVFSTC